MKETTTHLKRVISAENLLGLLEEGDRMQTVIDGNSMLPFIRGGKDRVTLIKASPNALKKGKIVVARVGGDTFYLHRIERVDDGIVTLRGDGNPYFREKCPSENIFAEAVTVTRNGKIYTPQSFAWRAMQKWWPSNAFLRRIMLAIYRRIML